MGVAFALLLLALDGFDHVEHARAQVAAGRAAPACTSCHVMDRAGRFRPAGERRGPPRPDSPYRVRSFSHAKHLAPARFKGRPGTPVDRCRTCHAAVEQVPGPQAPLPAMITCEGCHDGRTAFAARGPTCRRCHDRPDPRALPATAPPAPYDHAAHTGRGLTLGCEACHRLDARGAPRPASADHRPCSDEGCHATEFRQRAPRICSGCHVGTEPWRPLSADVPRRARTEFGVDFSHAAHSTADRCATCHTGIPGGAERGVGPAHAACDGAGCHVATTRPAGSPAPSLNACTSCHVPGLLLAHEAARDRRPWAARRRFHHEPHASTECGSCHVGVTTAARLAEVAPPAKPTCATCHDGVTAFKVTGHGCGRCHGG